MALFRYIPRDLVDHHLPFNKLLPAMRRAFMEFSSKESEQPRRIALWMGEYKRQFVMPSYSKREDILSTKITTIFPENAAKNLPASSSYLMLFNEQDGTLKCIMDSEPLSMKRTASASVVATQAIVEDTPEVLGILGTGNLAFAHVAAFSEAYNFKQIKVWSRNQENVEKFVAKAKEFSVTKCLTAEEAVRDADVVVTATSSTGPVLKGNWLKPGSHVNVAGATKPTWRETDDDCMNNAVVYADSIDGVEHESGDIILSRAPIYAEVGDILLKKKALKRGRITLFKSTGIAIEDAYAAKIVWESYSSTETEKREED